MTELIDRVVGVLQGLEWRVELDAEHPGGMLLEPADGEALWPFVAQVEPEDQQIAFYSLLPDEVPPDRREAVATVLTHANYGLTIGSFEIDVTDGDVRFRTSLDLGAAEVDDTVLAALVSPLVVHNLAAMDLWIDGLQAVADGADPDDLLA
ncbi:YbjN domain-containing protein [Nocardioides sp. W7]|uniref:YbjN domain-containing protein n=1 Tax=Nocardioides sp. W7 TaxID=2931390 RepID=UPI001FD3A921|nr:YbjN domain-containing protein [Nocardioides sp. W7]